MQKKRFDPLPPPLVSTKMAQNEWESACIQSFPVPNLILGGQKVRRRAQTDRPTDKLIEVS